jgi:hypothetical protein
MIQANSADKGLHTTNKAGKKAAGCLRAAHIRSVNMQLADMAWQTAKQKAITSHHIETRLSVSHVLKFSYLPIFL